MNGKSHRVSIRHDRPIDGVTLAICCSVRDACARAGLPYFIAGAAARDLILLHVHGCRTRRATRDVDFGVAVSSWADFERLKEGLVEHHAFAPGNAKHALTYCPADGAHPIGIDIIPYGGVEETGGHIHWPPHGDDVMNVSGFDVAASHALHVEFTEGDALAVASLPGLVLLKLFAWLDRGTYGAKDAIDLVTIASEYAAAGQEDRLWDEHPHLVTDAGYDLQVAGALLLAEDVREISPPDTLAELRSALETRNALERLIVQETCSRLLPDTDPEESAEVVALRSFWRRLFG